MHKIRFFRLALSQSAWLLLMPFALATLTACGREATDDRAATSPDGDQKRDTPQTAPKVEKKTDSSNELPLIFQKDEGVSSTQGTFRARVKTWKSGPQVTKNDDTRNEVSIEFATASGRKPGTFEALNVLPYMKIHGHPTPRAYFPVLNVEGNLMSLEKLGFIMSGPWEIIVQARVDGVEDSVEIPVVVP